MAAAAAAAAPPLYNLYKSATDASPYLLQAHLQPLPKLDLEPNLHLLPAPAPLLRRCFTVPWAVEPFLIESLSQNPREKSQFSLNPRNIH